MTCCIECQGLAAATNWDAPQRAASILQTGTIGLTTQGDRIKGRTDSWQNVNATTPWSLDVWPYKGKQHIIGMHESDRGGVLAPHNPMVLFSVSNILDGPLHSSQPLYAAAHLSYS